MYTTLILCLFGLVPNTLVQEDRVDIVEVCAMYTLESDTDKLMLATTQLIFWDAEPDTVHFRVRDWRLCPTKISISRNFSTHEWEVLWYDGLTMRRVYARKIKYSWINFDYDPEKIDQQFLKKEHRKKLSTPRVEVYYGR